MPASNPSSMSRRQALRLFAGLLTWGLARQTGDSAFSPREVADQAATMLKEQWVAKFLTGLPPQALTELHGWIVRLMADLPSSQAAELARQFQFSSAAALVNAASEGLATGLATFIDRVASGEADFGELLAARSDARVRHFGELIVGDEAYVPYWWVDAKGEGVEIRFHPRLSVLRRVDGKWQLQLRTGQLEIAELIREHGFASRTVRARFLGLVHDGNESYVIQETVCQFPSDSVTWVSAANPRMDDELNAAVVALDHAALHQRLNTLNQESLDRTLQLMAAYAEIEALRGETPSSDE